MKKLLTLTAALALLATACGSPGPEIQSTAVVADVLGSVEAVQAAAAAAAAEAPTPSVPPGCRLVTELDEYGFEVDVIKCDDEVPPVPENPEWLGSDSAKQAATMMRQALVDQAECGTRATYGELKTLVAASLPEYREPLLAAVAALEQGAAHCNTDKDAWAEAMSRAILRLEEFLRAVEVNTAADEDGSA